MNKAKKFVQWGAAMLAATGTVFAGAEAEGNDMPSIELLEYLAEFELNHDGHLIDPLEIRDEQTRMDHLYPTQREAQNDE